MRDEQRAMRRMREPAPEFAVGDWPLDLLDEVVDGDELPLRMRPKLGRFSGGIRPPKELAFARFNL